MLSNIVYCKAVSLLGFLGLVYMLELPELQCGSTRNFSLTLNSLSWFFKAYEVFIFLFFVFSSRWNLKCTMQRKIVPSQLQKVFQKMMSFILRLSYWILLKPRQDLITELWYSVLVSQKTLKTCILCVVTWVFVSLVFNCTDCKWWSGGRQEGRTWFSIVFE